MAVTIKPTAGPATSAAAAEPGAGKLGIVGGAADEAVANSGIAPSVVHSVAPSGRTWVCGLTRPSASHWRNWSAVTGPYSFWSAPMILYIGCFFRRSLVRLIVCDDWAGCKLGLARLGPQHGKGRAWQVAQHADDEHRRQNQPEPARTQADRQRLVAGLLLDKLRAIPEQERQGHNQHRVKVKGGGQMAVQQLIRRAQSAATGTEQAGGLVEEANRSEVILPRVKAEEHEARERGEKGTEGQGCRSVSLGCHRWMILGRSAPVLGRSNIRKQ